VNSIDVYFDYASPFAYIASEVLPAFSDRAGLAVRWKPIDQSRLSNYANGLPYSTLKRQYVVIDAVRSAEYHGVSIALPKPHPVESVGALRLAVVALEDPRFGELHHALFRAAWRDQRNVSSREVLADCITQAGGPVEQWLRTADGDDAGDRLAALTAEAEGRGVFGIPSLFLGDELFWGVDSLPMLEWRAAQSKPAGT
jgi:2-hydroxychromene-2-carboxylate isomerase